MPQLLSDLPIGAKIKFGTFLNDDIIWLVVDKNHKDYPSNSVTLRTEGDIYYLVFDVSGKSSSGVTYLTRQGRYDLSDIRQWLNSRANAGEWFVAQYNGDLPPSSNNVSSNPYAQWSGFLTNFSENEYSLILDTTIEFAAYNGVHQCTDKMFLLGAKEVGSTSSYISNSVKQTALLFGNTQASRRVTHSRSYANMLNTSVTKYYNYWLRDSVGFMPGSILQVTDAGSVSYYNAKTTSGIVPACNISANAKVSDTIDEDGCYSFIFNSAPSRPDSLKVPTFVYGGKVSTIAWNAATDPDGDKIEYILEAAYDGGNFEQIYKGFSTSYAHLVTFGKNSVQYRVKAIDPLFAESDYTLSSNQPIINNHSPIISGSDTHLGVKTSAFSQTYSISDEDNDSVTVIETVDDTIIRSYVCELNALNTLVVDTQTWLLLSNGTHALSIIARDSGGAETIRTYTFTKNVTVFSVETTTPMESETMPTRIIFTANYNIPSEAEIKVEVCNNGFDNSPTWEDATEILTSNLVYIFTNTSKTASKWGVRIRVTVDRNGGEGACYISGIGGNFE